ncbi:hypothetical protein OsccyDRAFT_0741 [Leptolyngbyaceae cyanobacterium JSC-12]|nr:hypothetical protein OsccyDRAFT_0741 [Leptolyngbyaceae cyanobacterium JSC-12]
MLGFTPVSEEELVVLRAFGTDNKLVLPYKALETRFNRKQIHQLLKLLISKRLITEKPYRLTRLGRALTQR